MATQHKLISVTLAAALLALTGASAADAAKPERASHLYLTSYNGDCTNILSVLSGKRVKSWEPVGGPCNTASAMAVDSTIRTLGARPEFIGAEYTLDRVPTGVTYTYPSSVTMDFPDGTTDGSANYAGGYFDGVVYKFTRDWQDPVPLFSTGVFVGGLTYDSDTNTLWVLDSRADFEGGQGLLLNYSMEGVLLSSFVVQGGSTPQPFGLAYDAKDHSLWISRIVGFDTPITLEKYTTSGQLLDTVTTPVVGIPGGLEFRLANK